MIKTTTSLLALSLLFGGVAIADEKVSGYEISTFLTGKTASCVKTHDNSTCDTYFAQDGAIKRFTPDNGKTRTGKWWVDDKDMLHVQWTGKKKSLAFDVMDPRDGTWKLLKRGKLKSLITGATPGDQIK